MLKVILSQTLFFLLTCVSCQSSEIKIDPTDPPPPSNNPDFLRGADLSYVNEMLDCGATYFDSNGNKENPYAIFRNEGADLVRLRLWHDPDWTNYSTYDDVKKAIGQIKEQGMKVLLDFHYSDDWADPSKQKVPAAWLPVVNDTQALGDSLYNYTYQVLSDLNDADLLPEYVQVGNEINSEILQDPNGNYDQINWQRNAALIKKGLTAVRDASNNFGKNIGVMLHIAQPENALWWFDEATQNGITDFDWIGISYYPQWSSYTLETLPTAIKTLISTYGKKLMVVETAYPFTLENKDAANNILGNDAIVAGYPATEQGQYDFLKILEKRIIEGGGEGLIYWEPAWVSTDCHTQWGQGSHWDNATLFNHSFLPTLGMKFYREE